MVGFFSILHLPRNIFPLCSAYTASGTVEVPSPWVSQHLSIALYPETSHLIHSQLQEDLCLFRLINSRCHISASPLRGVWRGLGVSCSCFLSEHVGCLFGICLRVLPSMQETCLPWKNFKINFPLRCTYTLELMLDRQDPRPLYCPPFPLLPSS